MATDDQNRSFPAGTFTNSGLAAGAAIGVPLAAILGEPAYMGIGVAVGAGIGLAIGTAVEDRFKRRGLIRPLTETERLRRRRGSWIALGAGVVVAAALIAIYFFVR